MENLKNGSDVLFILLGAVMVLAMHSGFAFLELGTVRRKSQVNALVKILCDFAVSTIAYFFIGYTLAYGANFLDSADQLAESFHRSFGLAVTTVRPFNTFGPRSHHEGDSGEVIPKFLLRCLAGKPMVIFGDGTQTRDFTYVSDSAAGILRAGEHEGAIGDTINLGFGSEVTINDLARQIAVVTGRPDAVVSHDIPRPGDVLRLYADMSHARESIGYAPAIPLADGLTRLLAWYREQGTSPEQLLEREVVRNWEATPVER